jgi:hypothetical protein
VVNEDIDRLLTEAGQRWQAAQPPPPEPDRTRWAAEGGSRWRPRAGRYLTVGVVAAAVAATIAGSMAIWPKAADGPRPDTGATPTPSAMPDPAALVVRDGDVVEAAGGIEADEGKPVRFCPPAPRFPVFNAPCPFAIVAKGVDLTRMTKRPSGDEDGRSGWVRLRGVYRAGTLEVTHQWAEEYSFTRRVAATPPSCQPPAGGWQLAERDGTAAALSQYVDANSHRFSGLHVTQVGGGSSGGPTVIVVGVVGEDPAAVQAELRPYYAGNLCAAPARYSADRLHQADEAVSAVVQARPDRQRATIWAHGGGPDIDRIEVEMVLLDPTVYAEFQKIGLDLLALNPWLRPAR